MKNHDRFWDSKNVEWTNRYYNTHHLTNPEQIKEVLDKIKEQGKVLEWGKGKKSIFDYEDNQYLSFQPFPQLLDTYNIVLIELYHDYNRTLYYAEGSSGVRLLYVTDIDFTLDGQMTARVENLLARQKEERAKETEALLTKLGEIDWYEENIKENWK